MSTLTITILVSIALAFGLYGAYLVIGMFIFGKKVAEYRGLSFAMKQALIGTGCLAIMAIILIFVYANTIVIDDAVRHRIMEESREKLPEIGLLMAP